MPDSSGDENDSRTASVGLPRARASNTGSNNSSRRSSQDRKQANTAKRRRIKGKDSTGRDVRDFVPQGATFSATGVLEVDPDSTSSSGSDSPSDSDGLNSANADPPNEKEDGLSTRIDATPDESRESRNETEPLTNANGGNGRFPRQSQFVEVNGKYWRSRSASESSANDESYSTGKRDVEEGEINDNDIRRLPSESDDSDTTSEDSEGDEEQEADNSIMLNVGSHDSDGHSSADGDDYEPRPLSIPAGGPSNGGGPLDTALTQSKEDALHYSSRKYPTAPVALADLNSEDFETQAKFIYYGREARDIDLSLPIACTECLQEGHLAEVCPSKECIHCGAWNKHQSSFCPSWRRCQRCRERGHDEQQCSSPLKSSASEVPCDLCGSNDHLELDCDVMWKLPQRSKSPGPVLVSISCSHCTSNRHLIGDCPSLPKPMISSSWTLNGFDPDMITNTNAVLPSKKKEKRNNQRSLRIRGRADFRSPSSDSDDMMAHPNKLQRVGRKPNRGSIRFDGGIGRNRDLAGPGNSRNPRQDYRDRQDSFANDPRPGRMRGKDSWQPASNGPPQGRSGPPSRNARGGGRGGRNRRGDNGDTYRPMPSSAKKNWDRFRL